MVVVIGDSGARHALRSGSPGVTGVDMQQTDMTPPLEASPCANAAVKAVAFGSSDPSAVCAQGRFGAASVQQQSDVNCTAAFAKPGSQRQSLPSLGDASGRVINPRATLPSTRMVNKSHPRATVSTGALHSHGGSPCSSPRMTPPATQLSSYSSPLAAAAQLKVSPDYPRRQQQPQPLQQPPQQPQQQRQPILFQSSFYRNRLHLSGNQQLDQPQLPTRQQQLQPHLDQPQHPARQQQSQYPTSNLAGPKSSPLQQRQQQDREPQPQALVRQCQQQRRQQHSWQQQQQSRSPPPQRSELESNEQSPPQQQQQQLLYELLQPPSFEQQAGSGPAPSQLASRQQQQPQGRQTAPGRPAASPEPWLEGTLDSLGSVGGPALETEPRQPPEAQQAPPGLESREPLLYQKVQQDVELVRREAAGSVNGVTTTAATKVDDDDDAEELPGQKPHEGGPSGSSGRRHSPETASDQPAVTARSDCTESIAKAHARLGGGVCDAGNQRGSQRSPGSNIESVSGGAEAAEFGAGPTTTTIGLRNICTMLVCLVNDVVRHQRRSHTNAVRFLCLFLSQILRRPQARVFLQWRIWVECARYRITMDLPLREDSAGTLQGADLCMPLRLWGKDSLYVGPYQTKATASQPDVPADPEALPSLLPVTAGSQPATRETPSERGEKAPEASAPSRQAGLLVPANPAQPLELRCPSQSKGLRPQQEHTHAPRGPRDLEVDPAVPISDGRPPLAPPSQPVEADGSPTLTAPSQLEPQFSARVLCSRLDWATSTLPTSLDSLVNMLSRIDPSNVKSTAALESNFWRSQ